MENFSLEPWDDWKKSSSALWAIFFFFLMYSVNFETACHFFLFWVLFGH